jgi:uncharacterized membrane protein YhaH (DUF805 family)
MFANLFGTSGRIGRGTWWLGQVVILFLAGALIASALTLHTASEVKSDSSNLVFIIFLIVFGGVATAINFCTTVKRYHDRGKSGWWFLMALSPGWLWTMIECGMLPGEDGDNDYGSPPGAKSSRESLGREISGMANSTSASFAKLDDNYIENYAKKFALERALQQAEPTQPSFGSGAARPVFGKR